MKIHITAPCITSGLSVDPAEQPSQYIEVRATPGAGGQGSIYEVVSVDGRRVAGLLVKIFGQGFPPPLKDIVRTIHDQGQSNGVMSCSSLRALPLFLFDGKAPSQGAVQGYVMRRVPGTSFDEILNSQAQRYISLPLTARLILASQFVDGMAALYNLTLVHADLNGQNLMVDMTATELAIIDVDGGAIARNSQVPVAIGKPEPGWLAPEIIRQQANTTNNQQISVDIKTDLWSIASGVHYLIFGMQPYFFIHTYSAIPAYLRSHRWPEARNLKGIRVFNQQALGFYEAEYRKIPELHDAFRTSFQDGFGSPNRRLSAYQWKQAIKRALLGAGVVIRQAPPPGPTPRPFAPVAPGSVVAQGPPAHVHPAAAAAGREWARSAAGVTAMLLVTLWLTSLLPSPDSYQAPSWMSGSGSGTSQPPLRERGGSVNTQATPPLPQESTPGASQATPIEGLLRQDPKNRTLWMRALNEWQTVHPKDNASVLGILGVVGLLERRRSPVEDGALTASLRAVGRFPAQFYLDLASNAESTGSHATAVAILSEGVAQVGNDQALRRELDNLQRALNSGESHSPKQKETVHVVAYDTDTVRAVNGPAARLIIHSAPNGSLVWVDTRYISTIGSDGAVSIEIPPGDHHVLVEREGFVQGRYDVRLFGGGEKKIAAKLEPKPGSLSVSTIAGATIEIDGVASGPSRKEVQPGSHLVLVSKAGYLDFKQWVEVPPGQDITVRAVLLAPVVMPPVSGNRVENRPSPSDVSLPETEAIEETSFIETAEEKAFRQAVVENDVEQTVEKWAQAIMNGSQLRLAVRHDHRSIRIHGLTNGTLTIASSGVRFVALQWPEDSFAVDWSDVKEVKANGLNKRDRSVVALELKVIRLKGGKRDGRDYKFVTGRGWTDHEQDVKCNDCVPLIPAVISLIQTVRARATGVR